MANNNQYNVPFFRSQSADFATPQARSLTNTSNTMPTNSSGSFHRRTLESARQIRDSLNSVFREIEPFVVETALMQNSVSQLINRPQSEPDVSRQPNNIHQDGNDSFVINLDAGSHSPAIPENIEHINNGESSNQALGENFPNNLPSNNNEANNNPDDGNNAERMQTVLEVQQFLHVLLKYLPFFLILFAKTIYDCHEAIFVISILFGTFAHSNAAVKKETLKRHKRSLSTLSIELVYILVCLLFIHYVFEDDFHNFNSVLNLVLIRTFTTPLTVWNLLWITIITDFTLKLITVMVKIFLTMLPASVLEFKKRGKVYLFIEAVSQLYRSIATIQPWLYYLLESYQGPEKIVAVFLSAFYMISKGTDLMTKVVFIKRAFLKLLQNASIGTFPNKDQIQTAGDYCPICHDQYDSPVLLTCRHIFCESCVSTWFDREQTCPLCRAKIVDDPSWRDGSTSHFVQLF